MSRACTTQILKVIAYRAHHSTETAVLKVLADILKAIDTENLAVLALLDLSAAFDTVDHARLLQRLKTSYGISGTVLNWLSSYLINCSQFVRCDASKSTPRLVTCGVPQVSVVGPILFLLYTACFTQRTCKDLSKRIGYYLIYTPLIRRFAVPVVQQKHYNSRTAYLHAMMTSLPGYDLIDFN